MDEEDEFFRDFEKEYAPYPDMYDTWQQSRELIGEFAQCVRDFKGDAIPFSQAFYIDFDSSITHGQCYGLSLYYLVYLTTDKSAKDFLADAYSSAGARTNPKFEKYVRENPFHSNTLAFQKHPHNSENGFDLGGDKLQAFVSIKGCNPQVKWMQDSWPFRPAQGSRRFYNMRKLSSHLIQRSPSYWMLACPEHVMAATVDREISTFFDPNFGAAVFDGNTDNFRKFLTKWLKRRDIILEYRGDNRNLEIQAIHFESAQAGF